MGMRSFLVSGFPPRSARQIPPPLCVPLTGEPLHCVKPVLRAITPRWCGLQVGSRTGHGPTKSLHDAFAHTHTHASPGPLHTPPAMLWGGSPCQPADPGEVHQVAKSRQLRQPLRKGVERARPAPHTHLTHRRDGMGGKRGRAQVRKFHNIIRPRGSGLAEGWMQGGRLLFPAALNGGSPFNQPSAPS